MDTAISDSMKLQSVPGNACEGPSYLALQDELSDFLEARDVVAGPCDSWDRCVVSNAFSGIPAVQSCRDQSQRRGDLIHDGVREVQVNQLLRISANMFTCAQDRNLKGRFKFSGNILTSLVKCPEAHANDSDLRWGNTVLCAFQMDPTSTYVSLYLGRVRQIVSTSPNYTKKRQVFLSVDRADTDAEFLAFPFCLVTRHGDEVRLQVTEEPAEYYAVVGGSASEGADDEVGENGEVHAPTVTLLSPIIHHDVDVDWGVLGEKPTVSSVDVVMLLEQLASADRIKVALGSATARKRNKV